MNKNLNCPCSSGKTYEACCRPFHQGALPQNALELMRSRFSAYVKNLPEYIIKTTHPASPHYHNEREAWIANIVEFSKNTLFENLEVLHFQEKNSLAIVIFTAHLSQDGEDASFTEKSYFEKVKGQWTYRTGELEKGSYLEFPIEDDLRLLPLAYYGEPVLRKKAEPVGEITEAIRTLVQDMIETMDSCRGLGLAAPQVHQPLRLFVIRKPIELEKGGLETGDVIVFINPELYSLSQETWHASEGCLSLPTVRAEVERSTSLIVEYTDLEGKRCRYAPTGWEAKVIQHENDHINGILFIDHLSDEERMKLEPALDLLKERLQ